MVITRARKFRGLLDFYVLLGLFTKRLSSDTPLPRAHDLWHHLLWLLFSFVGTMLGGIWADQSWGRFWGWDPKNGALLIVLWGALMLHARWGNLTKERGFSFWQSVATSSPHGLVGTNMLGGLTLRFMDKAFIALVAFVASQLFIIALGGLPPPPGATSKSKKQDDFTQIYAFCLLFLPRRDEDHEARYAMIFKSFVSRVGY